MSVKPSTSNPAKRAPKDPNRVYVYVQKPSDRFPESPLDNILNDMVSPSNPDEMMYQMESSDVRVTGNSQVVEVSCLRADHEALLKANAKEGRDRLRMPDQSTREATKSSGPGSSGFHRIEHGDDVIVSS